jgi:hypothetical protein
MLSEASRSLASLWLIFLILYDRALLIIYLYFPHQHHIVWHFSLRCWPSKINCSDFYSYESKTSLIWIVVSSTKGSTLQFTKSIKIFQFSSKRVQDWVAQTLLKFKCQLKLNWHLNLLEMYIELIYT